MARDVTIPHAHTIKRIDDPPCVILHIETALVQNPSTPGFNEEAKRAMLAAIAEVVERDCLDGYRIVWSVAASPTVIRKPTAA